ncbi:MAG: Smr/MutS family endonuclease [Gammaproteobacteria bacterium]|nr:Smr/MutS family endonuclease [Gammaproteobacteria bacterium]
MTKKPDPPENEHDLFRELMDDVRPLQQDKTAPYRPKKPPRPIKREQDEKQVIRDMMSDPVSIDELETGEELLFSRSGIQPNVMRKLRRGQFSIEAELDLHRLTSDQARQAVAEFLPEMSQLDKRCVRIIHGKGHGSFNKTPVIKNKLNHWLQQRDEVLAFCSARPVDGGTGAIYVLLRKSKR